MPYKRRPGRPLKPIAEKPRQFSIRLRPRLKIGLELLAADMQQSISQTAELALQEMFLKFPLSNGKTVDDMLREFPPMPTEGERILITYRHLPNALPLPERLLAQMVWESKEMANAQAKGESAIWTMISWSSMYWPVLEAIAKKRGMDVQGLELQKILEEEARTRNPPLVVEPADAGP